MGGKVFCVNCRWYMRPSFRDKIRYILRLDDSRFDFDMECSCAAAHCVDTVTGRPEILWRNPYKVKHDGCCSDYEAKKGFGKARKTSVSDETAKEVSVSGIKPEDVPLAHQHKRHIPLPPGLFCRGSLVYLKGKDRNRNYLCTYACPGRWIFYEDVWNIWNVVLPDGMCMELEAHTVDEALQEARYTVRDPFKKDEGQQAVGEAHVAAERPSPDTVLPPGLAIVEGRPFIVRDGDMLACTEVTSDGKDCTGTEKRWYVFEDIRSELSHVPHERLFFVLYPEGGTALLSADDKEEAVLEVKRSFNGLEN